MQDVKALIQQAREIMRMDPECLDEQDQQHARAYWLLPQLADALESHDSVIRLTTQIIRLFGLHTKASHEGNKFAVGMLTKDLEDALEALESGDADRMRETAERLGRIPE